MNGHGVEKKLTIGEKVKIIHEVEKSPPVSRNEIAVFRATRLHQIRQFYRNVQLLNRKVGVGNIWRN
jgi:hypothetical protein